MTSDTRADVRAKIRKYMRVHVSSVANVALADQDSLLEAQLIDSLGILDLVAFLEQTFGIQVVDDDLNPDNFDSIEALVHFVGRKL